MLRKAACFARSLNWRWFNLWQLFHRLENSLSTKPSQKADRKRERAWSGHNSISDAAKLICRDASTTKGNPINQQSKAGFNRRREVREVSRGFLPTLDCLVRGRKLGG